MFKLWFLGLTLWVISLLHCSVLIMFCLCDLVSDKFASLCSCKSLCKPSNFSTPFVFSGYSMSMFRSSYICLLWSYCYLIVLVLELITVYLFCCCLRRSSLLSSILSGLEYAMAWLLVWCWPLALILWTCCVSRDVFVMKCRVTCL